MVDATMIGGLPGSPPALTGWGRGWRSAMAVLVGVLLLWGTLWGNDDDFPFGPFRMFSTRNNPDGIVRAARVEAVDTSGRQLVVPDAATGLRRAEIEGQIPRFVQNPSLLGEVARAHDRRRPHEPSYSEVRVVERMHQLRDGGPTGEYVDRVVAVWRRE